MSRKPETRGFKGGFLPAENTDLREGLLSQLHNGRDHQTQNGTKDHPQNKKGEFKHGHTKLAKRGHFQGTRRERSDCIKESGRNQEKIKLP